MSPDLEHIKFTNQQNPTAQFDLINLEDLFERKFEDHSPDELHIVEFYLIILIDEGEGKHTIDFTEHHCQTGTVLTIRKNQIHKFHRGTSIKGRALLFTEEFMVSYFEQLESMRSIQLFNEMLASPQIQLDKQDLQEVQEIVARITTEYHKVNDSYSLGIIRSELHIMISKLFRLKAKQDEQAFARKYLKEFIQFQALAETKALKTVKVKDYAADMGLSTKTLNTVTRSITNLSAKEFIDEICILQVKRMLINTEASVKEIAYASGFEESTNFYKYFKRLTGITPEEFRSPAE
ncbi:MAG: AraC family transcriptional regulator [Saprospiraceae bacterium]